MEKKQITVIFQDPVSKAINRFLYSSIEEVQSLHQKYGKVLVDCDEDAYLIPFQTVSSTNLDVIYTTPIFPSLVPVITVDTESNILMQAYTNQEAVFLSFQKEVAHYFSRSRNQLWLKGETSGHTQKIIEIKYDPIQNLFLYMVEQRTAACHTGAYSCFYREYPLLPKGGKTE